MNEWAQQRVEERASEASSEEQANEWAVRANERTEERMAQYSTRQFHIIWTHRAMIPRKFNAAESSLDFIADSFILSYSFFCPKQNLAVAPIYYVFDEVLWL